MLFRALFPLIQLYIYFSLTLGLISSWFISFIILCWPWDLPLLVQHLYISICWPWALPLLVQHLYISICWPWALPLLVQHYTFSFVGLGFYPSWSNIIHFHLEGVTMGLKTSLIILDKIWRLWSNSLSNEPHNHLQSVDSREFKRIVKPLVKRG